MGIKEYIKNNAISTRIKEYYVSGTDHWRVPLMSVPLNGISSLNAMIPYWGNTYTNIAQTGQVNLSLICGPASTETLANGKEIYFYAVPMSANSAHTTGDWTLTWGTDPSGSAAVGSTIENPSICVYNQASNIIYLNATRITKRITFNLNAGISSITVTYYDSTGTQVSTTITSSSTAKYVDAWLGTNLTYDPAVTSGHNDLPATTFVVSTNQTISPTTTWTANILRGTGVARYQYKINSGDWVTSQTAATINIAAGSSITVQAYTAATGYVLNSQPTATKTCWQGNNNNVTVPQAAQYQVTINRATGVASYDYSNNGGSSWTAYTDATKTFTVSTGTSVKVKPKTAATNYTVDTTAVQTTTTPTSFTIVPATVPLYMDHRFEGSHITTTGPYSVTYNDDIKASDYIDLAEFETQAYWYYEGSNTHAYGVKVETTINIDWATRQIHTYAISFTAGSGLSSAYLNTYSTATSGSASGSLFNYNSTVYVFGVLESGFRPRDGWVLVSGTASTAGAKYRISSITVTSAYNFGTLSALEYVTVTAPSAVSGWQWTNTNKATSSGGSISPAAAGTMYYYQSTSSTTPTFSTSTWTTTRPTAKDINTYYLWVYAYVTNTSTYTGDDINKVIYVGSVTIAKRTISLTWGTTTWTYDGSEKTVSAPTAGNTISGYSCTVSVTNNKRTNAGSQTVTASISSGDTYYKLPSNYTATLTINKADPVITWSCDETTYPTTAYVKYKSNVAGTVYETYNGTQLTSSNYSTAAQVTKSLSANTQTNIDGGSVAYTWTIYTYFVPTDTANYNHMPGGPKTLKVNKADITYTAPTYSRPTYNGSAQALCTTGSATGGTIYYGTGSSSTSAPSSWSTSRPTATNCGTTYYVWYKITGDSNHNDVAQTYVGTTSYIAKATPVLTISGDGTYTYNGTTRYLTCSISPSTAGTINYGTSSSLGSSVTYSSGVSIGSIVNSSTSGSAAITRYAQFVPTDTTNYNSSSVVGPKTITINQATGSITYSPSNVSCTFSTGAQTVQTTVATNATGTISYTLNSINSATPPTGWSIDSSAKLSVPASAGVGTYTVSITANSAVSTNYTAVNSGAKTFTLTVNKATSSITLSATTAEMFTGSTLNVANYVTGKTPNVDLTYAITASTTTSTSSISGSTVTAGAMSTANDDNQSITVTITNPGNANYSSSTKTFTIVVKKNQYTLTFNNSTTSVTYGSTLSVAATCSPSATISYTTTGNYTSLSSTTLTGTTYSGSNKDTISASVGRTTTYAAKSITRQVSVTKADQTWTLSVGTTALTSGDSTAYSISGTTYGTVSAGISPTTYASLSSNTITASGSPNGATTTLTVTYPGDTNHNSRTQTKVFILYTKCVAPTQSGTLTYNGSSQTATFGTATYCSVTSGNTGTNAGNHIATFTTTDSSKYRFPSAATTKAVSWTIGKATLTATADNKSITYGASAPTYTITYSGWKGSDSSSLITTAPTKTCSYNTSSASTRGAGSYTISLSGGNTLTNYNYSYVSGTLTVGKATLTCTGSSHNVTYGDAKPTLSVSYSGWKYSEGTNALTTVPTAASTYTSSTPVASSPVAVTVSGGAATNYSFSYVNGAITIALAVITTIAAPTAKNPTYNGSSQQIINNGTTGGGSYSYSNQNQTNWKNGGYSVTWSFTPDANHTLGPEAIDTGTVTANISKRSTTTTITRSAASFTYGNTAVTYTYSNSNLVSGHTATYSNSNAPSSLSTPGDYTVTGSTTKIMSGSTDVTTNYTLTGGTTTVTVNKRAITVTAPANANPTYNGNAQYYHTAGSVSGVPSGGASGGTFTYCATSSGTYSTTRLSATNAGTSYACYWKFAINSTYYTTTSTVSGNLTCSIAKATGTITYSPAAKSCTYSTSSQTVTCTAASGNTGTLSYTLDSVKQGSTSITGFSLSGTTLTVPASRTAGSYTVTITAKSAATTNYTEVTSQKSFTLTINKATPTFTRVNGTAVYPNTANGTVTASVAGKAMYGTSTSAMTSELSLSAGTAKNIVSRTSASNIGTSTVYAYFVPTDTTNYNNVGSSSSGYLTITATTTRGTGKCTPSTATPSYTSVNSATVTIPSQSGSLTYNGSSQSPTWSNYDSTKSTISGGTASATNASSYSRTASLNNTAYFAQGTTTFTVAVFENATVTASSSDTSVATVSVGSTSSNSATVTVTCKKAGTATISLTAAQTTNYAQATGSATLTVSNGTYIWTDSTTANKTISWSIGKKEVGLSWGTTSWTYDKATHSTTCTATGLVGSDTCTVTLSNNSVGANVGSATVTASALSNSNYKLPSANTKSISIVAREVTLTWGTITWTYDGNTHSTTCTAGNVVSGDTCTVTLTGNSVGANVGTATVTASSLSNSNYKLPSSKTNTLTINKKQLTVTAPTAISSLNYTGSAQTLINAGSYTGTVGTASSTNGGTFTYNVGSGSYGTTLPTGTAIGAYTVGWIFTPTSNYSASTGSGSVSVNIYWKMVVDMQNYVTGWRYKVASGSWVNKTADYTITNIPKASKITIEGTAKEGATEYNYGNYVYGGSNHDNNVYGNGAMTTNITDATISCTKSRKSFTITLSGPTYGAWRTTNSTSGTAVTSQTAYYGDIITSSGNTLTCYKWDATSTARWTVYAVASATTAQYTYSTPTISGTSSDPITAAKTITATNTRTLRTYTVTFSATNGSWSPTSIANVPYGTTWSTSGLTVTLSGSQGSSTYTKRATTVDYTSGDATITATTGTVTGATTITGVTATTARTYTIKWIGADGSTALETDSSVAYNATLTYNGSTPTKASTAQYNYTFNAWKLGSTSGSTVVSGTTKNPGSTSSTTINIYATFTATLRSYNVTIKKGGTTAAIASGTYKVDSGSATTINWGTAFSVNYGSYVKNVTATASPSSPNISSLSDISVSQPDDDYSGTKVVVSNPNAYSGTIYYGTTSGATTYYKAISANNSIPITGLTAGTTYYFFLRVVKTNYSISSYDPSAASGSTGVQITGATTITVNGSSSTTNINSSVKSCKPVARQVPLYMEYYFEGSYLVRDTYSYLYNSYVDTTQLLVSEYQVGNFIYDTPTYNDPSQSEIAHLTTDTTVRINYAHRSPRPYTITVQAKYNGSVLVSQPVTAYSGDTVNSINYYGTTYNYGGYAYSGGSGQSIIVSGDATIATTYSTKTARTYTLNQGSHTNCTFSSTTGTYNTAKSLSFSPATGYGYPITYSVGTTSGGTNLKGSTQINSGNGTYTMTGTYHSKVYVNCSATAKTYTITAGTLTGVSFTATTGTYGTAKTLAISLQNGYTYPVTWSLKSGSTTVASGTLTNSSSSISYTMSGTYYSSLALTATATAATITWNVYSTAQTSWDTFFEKHIDEHSYWKCTSSGDISEGTIYWGSGTDTSFYNWIAGNNYTIVDSGITDSDYFRDLCDQIGYAELAFKVNNGTSVDLFVKEEK